MGPVRTSKSQPRGENRAGPSQRKSKRPQSQQEETAAPGVVKIKASLRQTRRFLAKDNLAADVRVESERRLKAQEAELERALLNRQEKKLADRYHSAKFFERTKVERKLRQTKKNLSKSEITAAEKKKLETVLFELRIDLNYIMHYPKMKKYISLFPPESRQASQKSETPEKPVEVDTSKTDADRQEVRTWIRAQMENGELPQHPEESMGGHASKGPRAAAVDWKPKAGSHGKAKQADELEVTQRDEFFASDDEEDAADDDS